MLMTYGCSTRNAINTLSPYKTVDWRHDLFFTEWHFVSN